ncbi:hypothetical protein [Vulcanisaeta thermophila]|uniref:hypothetical protein n=1 Tax=Vulcanisaeta thermophila TaxID=867917 RepID=UPI00085297EC|nr:hypothetical protein [Vulcanisaeta thermophila]
MGQASGELERIVHEVANLVKQGYALTNVLKQVAGELIKDSSFNKMVFNEVRDSMVKISPGNVPVGLFTQCSMIPGYYLAGKSPSVNWGDISMHLLGKMLHNLAINELKARIGNRCVEGVEVMYNYDSWTLRGKPDLDCGDYYLEFKTIMGRVTKSRLLHDLIQAGFYSVAGKKNTYILYLVLIDGIFRTIVPIEVIPEVGGMVLYAFRLWVNSVKKGNIGALTAKTTSCRVCRFRDICIMRSRNPHEIVLPGRELLDDYLEYMKEEVAKAGVRVID